MTSGPADLAPIWVVISFLTPFVLSLLLLQPWLFGGAAVSRTSNTLFAGTFAGSVLLILLMIDEIIGVLDPATRWLTWRIVLVSLSVVLIVVLPFLFAVSVARDQGVSLPLARVLGVILEAGFLWMFWRLGSFFPITAREHDALSIEGVVGERRGLHTSQCAR